MARSDAELIDACLRGEEQAWHELVARYSRLVYSIPRHRGFSAEDSDDVFQNVFTIVYRQLPSLREPRALAAWLITITQRQCSRVHRPGSATLGLDETTLESPEQLDDPVQLWERAQLVEQALNRLDERCRELLRALFLDTSAESYQAVAARLQIPIGSIGPTRARCFKKLAQILEEMGIDSYL
jgi:RNA polymerase sigma factor (sigma-70 family)